MPAPTRIEAPRYASRERLIAHVAGRLQSESWPRLLLAAILVAAGLAAFGTAVLLLWSGFGVFQSMAFRYPAAALAGYAAFLLLIRAWIAARRGTPVDHSWLDFIPDPPIGSSGAPRMSLPEELPLELPDAGGASFDFDADAIVWLAAVAVFAAGGFIAAAYAVYIAPVLLAEIALDAAIVSTVYYRLREQDSRYWLGTAIGRTWFGAAVIVLSAAAAGYAFDVFVPDARSIGGVMKALLG